MAYSKQNFQDGQILTAANLEKMENGIIAGQGAKNLLVNSDFRNPIDIDNKIGATNANPCFTRWNFERANSNTTTQIIKIDNGIRVYKNGGVARFYQSYNYNLLGKTVSYAVGTTEGIFVGSCSVSTSSVYTRIGTHTGYLSVYQGSASEKAIFSLYFNDNTEDAIDLYWAALYEGAYTKDTLPDYVPKSIQQEMMDCGIPLYPKNLLKNSDFTNPSNVKRGMTSYSGAFYDIIDLWDCATPSGSTTTTELTSNGLKFTHSDGSSMIYLRQNVSDFWKNNKAYTLGYYKNDGTFYYSGYYNSGDGKINIVIPSGTTVTSVVCYEGKYTEDMLPPYVPKDKYIETLNCSIPTSPRNILKNSDFIHPLNTTGFTSKSSGAGTLIDGWTSWIAGNGGNIELTSSGIKLSPPSSENIGIYQNIENYELNKIHTIVVYINNKPYIKTFQMGNWGAGTAFGPIDFFSIPTANVLLRIKDTYSAVTIQKVALYEGAYTVDTLPGYISNTKHIEMLNCNVPLAPHNLLDNSDFRNPVNQRGQTSYSASGYTIDRWLLYDPNGDGTVAINNGYISLTGGSGAVSLSCRFSKGFLDANKTYTAMICDNLGNINPTSLIFYDSFDSFEFSAGAGETKNIVWAALYEGSYDASTLPAYQPKGFAAELAECQRYYQFIPEQTSCVFSTSAQSNKYFASSINFPQMRIAPTVSLKKDSNGYIGVVQGVAFVSASEFDFAYKLNGTLLPATTNANYAGKVMSFYGIELNADL